MPKKSRKQKNELPILHPDAAGVDIGAEEIFVAVPADRYRFGAFQLSHEICWKQSPG